VFFWGGGTLRCLACSKKLPKHTKAGASRDPGGDQATGPADAQCKEIWPASTAGRLNRAPLQPPPRRQLQADLHQLPRTARVVRVGLEGGSPLVQHPGPRHLRGGDFATLPPPGAADAVSNPQSPGERAQGAQHRDTERAWWSIDK
jgi:hypothetical protein